MSDLDIRRYRGTCDASAAVLVGTGDHFVAASDEDSILRVYDRREPGMFVHSVDVGGVLGINPGDEADVEGAARIGSRIYWIGSHGTNSKGVPEESRRRLFATSVSERNGDVTIAPVGVPYTNLLQDMISAPQLAGLGLDAASRLPPKEQGGLSIEGLAPTQDDDLLIGFRNPIIKGKALILRLHNAADLVAGRASRAAVSRAALLDLEGRGIRAIEPLGSQTYLIVAGAFDATRDFRVFRWIAAGGDTAIVPVDLDLGNLNPEELIAVPGRETCEVELLSDDSERPVGDKRCKKVKDDTKRTFRALRVRLPMAIVAGT